MKDFRTKNWYTIIKRHVISLFSVFLKFWFVLLIAIVVYLITFYYFNDIDTYFEISNYIDRSIHHTWFLEIIWFIMVFVLLNYAFFSLIINLVKYAYNLIIIYEDQIVIIEWSLLIQDRIEIINSFKIVKVDAYLTWIFANLFHYGELIIELQKNEVKVFCFISRPYEMLMIIKKQRDIVLNDRRKKYIVHYENDSNDDINKWFKEIDIDKEL